MSEKPPLPERLFDPWERMPVDEKSTPFREIRKLAVLAADDWVFGDEGPYKQPGMTQAQMISGAVREALLHLLELGLIDIDAERIASAKGWPMSRRAFLPTDTDSPA
jgi:hypothetical protein